MSPTTPSPLFSLGLALTFGLSSSAVAGDVEVVYSEIVTSPTSLVPGALNSAGQPAVARFIALEDMNVSHDGSQWVVKGRTDQGSTNDSILLLGGGLTGTMFLQDDQPFLGGQPGELYDFFDSGNPVSWDEAGNIAFSARAKGGVSSVKEKLVFFDGVTHTVVLTESSPALGLQDIASNPTGDELIGNSIGSVYLRNDGKIGFVNTPIQNCSSFNYPAYFLDNTGFLQSGVSAIAGETWDSFSLSGTGGTPDGAHWYSIGDTDAATSADGILAVDGAVVLREGQPVAGSTMIMTAVFDARMVSTGDWVARGDDPNNDDWAVRNNVLLAKTGDPISGSENYGDSFAALTLNRVGDWAMVTNTSEANADLDTVLLLNGAVVSRESDPVDLDGNGQFDDGVFVRGYNANDLWLSDAGVIYAILTLKDAVGTNLGDAFVRLQAGPLVSYGSGCPGTGGFTPELSISGNPTPGSQVLFSVQNGLGGATSYLAIGFQQAAVFMGSGCTLNVLPLQAFVGPIPLGGFGAGAGAVQLPLVLPAGTTGLTVTFQSFVADPGGALGFSNSNGFEMTIE
ncbi:MAG: hypothetical protein ACF8XB_20795 [Planctomycetota bacterium JB042]